MPVRPFGRIVRICCVAECFGSSVRVPAISSESPSSDAARAREMANERTIGQDRPSPLRYPCPWASGRAGRAHRWRTGTALYLARLFESQCHLPQVVGHMVGSTQQYSQSVPGRIFGVIFLGHGVVSLQPFVRRKIFKLREQFTVYLVPIFLKLRSRRELSCFVWV